MRKISWITGDYFLDTDIVAIRNLCSFYKINWIIVISKSATIDYEKFVRNVLEGSKVSLSFVYLHQRSRSIKIISAYYDLIKRMKTFNPDVYYLSFLGIPYALLMYKFKLPLEKCVIPCHNVTTPKGAKTEKIAKLYTHFWLTTFKNIQVFSKSQYTQLIKKYREKNVLYTPMAIKDYGEFKCRINKLESTTIRFLFFGNIVEYKRIDVLIKAAEILAEESLNFKVRIAGACSNWDKYQILIKHPEVFELNIKRIPNEDVADLFADSHYFVMPYQDIAQSGAITVAFRYNLPVICSDIEPFYEFVKDGETGFMFKSKDAIALANKMKWIIKKHKSIYHLICEQEQKFVDENFSLDAIVDKYKCYINSI